MAFAQANKPARARKAAALADPMAVHRASLVIDSHADTTQRFLDENFDLATDTPVSEGHFDFGKVKAGNLGAEFFSIWVDPRYEKEYAKRAFRLIDSVYMQAQKHPDRMMMAFSPADIEKAHREKKLAALMGIEGGHAIENDLGLLRDFYRLGVRYMTLTWINTNDWADASGDIDDPKVKHHKGLTGFGVQVVREMNRLGMMVDVSHVSDRTFFRTLAISRAPVIASHSSARALTNHGRNMTDDMLKALSRNGGVCMVNFYAGFVDDDFRKAYDALDKDREAAIAALAEKFKDKLGSPEHNQARNEIYKQFAAKIPRPPLKALIDHIDHVAKVAGIDHVGLGSDFDGVDALPEGIDSVADLPKITAALMERGYTVEQVRKILGGNLMRVFREVEQMAKQIRSEPADPAAVLTNEAEDKR